MFESHDGDPDEQEESSKEVVEPNAPFQVLKLEDLKSQCEPCTMTSPAGGAMIISNLLDEICRLEVVGKVI